MKEDIKIHSLDLEVPNWINQAITVGEVEAINQGGCASGAIPRRGLKCQSHA